MYRHRTVFSFLHVPNVCDEPKGLYKVLKKMIWFPRNYLKDDSVVDITVEDPSDNFVR